MKGQKDKVEVSRGTAFTLRSFPDRELVGENGLCGASETNWNPNVPKGENPGKPPSCFGLGS